MSGINWEQKYKTLKKNFISAIDIAYRNGFEQGYEQATRDQFLQQQQQQQMMAQQQAQQQMQGLPPELQQQMQAGGPQDQNNVVDMLRQQVLQNQGQQLEDEQSISSKIDELDEVLNKTEKAEKLKNSILGIAKMFNKNLNYQQKRNLVGQEKMVQDIIEKWKKQKENAIDDFSEEIKKF